MTNNRDKGKRGERMVATLLRDIFPDVRRNAGTQSQSGGVDLENTGCLDVEVKYGKAYKSKKIRAIIDQVEKEGKKENWKVAFVIPEREKGYVIIPQDDFIEMLSIMKKEKIV